jgi:hypothetical protein
MKRFTEYLDKMGYSWNDFDRTHEMENLIEQYADERVNQALRIHAVVGRSEQYFCCKEQIEQIEQRCNEQCLGCFQFENKD